MTQQGNDAGDEDRGDLSLECASLVPQGPPPHRKRQVRRTSAREEAILRLARLIGPQIARKEFEPLHRNDKKRERTS
jgi:hypothetical protein